MHAHVLFAQTNKCQNFSRIFLLYVFFVDRELRKSYLFLFMQLNSSMIGQRYNVCIAGKRFLILSLSKALGLKRFVTVVLISLSEKKKLLLFSSTLNFQRKMLYLCPFLQEDDKIIDLVRKYGPTKWSIIAKSLPGRIGKQCRERYSSDHVHIVRKVICIILNTPSN